MKQCPSCGRYSRDDARECANCGFVYPVLQAPAEPATGPTAPAEPAQPFGWQAPNSGNQPYSQPGPYPPYGVGNPYGSPYGGCVRQEPEPVARTRKAFLGLRSSAQLRKGLRTAAILGYVLGGVNLLAGPALTGEASSAVDGLLILGLTLAIHLGQSRVCAVVLAIYAAENVLLGMLTLGITPGLGIVAVAALAIRATFRIETAWRAYQLRNGLKPGPTPDPPENSL